MNIKQLKLVLLMAAQISTGLISQYIFISIWLYVGAGVVGIWLILEIIHDWHKFKNKK